MSTGALAVVEMFCINFLPCQVLENFHAVNRNANPALKEFWTDLKG